MPNLTVILVNYNFGEYLSKALKSIADISDEAKMTVFVVDNNSLDDSINQAKKVFPEVHFILNDQNLGFGKACNLGLSLLKDEYVLFLNPDVVLEKGVIKRMVAVMEEDKKIGACTCEVVLPDGRIDLTAHRGFPTPWASLLYFLGNDSLYHLSNQKMDSIHEVDAISGAFFLTRKSVLEKTGGFDEDYFMYAEDIDLCFRIKQAGFKIVYVPDVSVVHYKGVSSGLKRHSQNISLASLETKQRSLNAFYETMKIFYKKHYQKNYPFFVNWLVYLGINLRWWLAKRNLTV